MEAHRAPLFRGEFDQRAFAISMSTGGREANTWMVGVCPAPKSVVLLFGAGGICLFLEVHSIFFWF